MIEITREGIKVKKMPEARGDKLTYNLCRETGTLECLHATRREVLRVKRLSHN